MPQSVGRESFSIDRSRIFKHPIIVFDNARTVWYDEDLTGKCSVLLPMSKESYSSCCYRLRYGCECDYLMNLLQTVTESSIWCCSDYDWASSSRERLRIPQQTLKDVAYCTSLCVRCCRYKSVAAIRRFPAGNSSWMNLQSGSVL